MAAYEDHTMTYLLLTSEMKVLATHQVPMLP